VSKDEAFGDSRSTRRRSPGLHAGYGATIYKTAGPVFRDRTGTRLCANGRSRVLRYSKSQARVSVSSGTNESQATVDVVTTAITNHKMIPGGYSDYTAPPPINTSAEHEISQYSVSPRCSKTYPGGLARFGTFEYPLLAVARPTQGRLAQFRHFPT